MYPKTTFGVRGIYRFGRGALLFFMVLFASVFSASAQTPTLGGTLTVCAGSMTTLTASPEGGTWTSSNISRASVGASSGVVTGVSAGTVVMTYSIPGASATTVVTVNASPNNITLSGGANPVCVGQALTLTETVLGGSWMTSDMSVAALGTTSSTAMPVTGMGTGTATISYMLSNGCSKSYVVSVNAAPASISGATGLCLSSTTTLTNSTGGGTWSSSNTGVASIGASSGIVAGAVAGTANISYIINASCYTTRGITINALPAAIGGTMSLCAGSTATLTNATAGGSWSTMSSNIELNASTGWYMGLSAGTASVTYTTAAGCSKTATVTVNALPADITGTMSVCAGLTTTLADASTPGMSWTSSSTAVATITSAGVVTGIAAGTARITYTLSTGCKTSTEITVNALPAAITGTLKVCVGLTTDLADATSGGSWTSSNTSVATIDAETGVVTGVAAGTARITYTLGTGCIKTAIATVNALPTSITGPTSVCVGSSITVASTPGGGTWTSGDVSIATIGATTGKITGVAEGSVAITYTLSTGCIMTTWIMVNRLPSSIFGTAAVCVGSVATLGIDELGGTWSNAASTVASVSGSDGSFTGVAAGTSVVTYSFSTGCYRTKTVTVNANPANINGTAVACIGLTTALSDPTGGGTWSSSDMSVATVGSSSGVVTGIASGTAYITYQLTATSCLNTKIVTINGTPATIEGSTPICIGTTLSLTNGTTDGTWTSSNTTIATVGSASGVVTSVGAGTATISYTATTGCKTTAVVTVNGYPAAISGNAAFCQGNSITLTDATTGGSWSTMSSGVSFADASSGVVLGVASGTSVVTYTAATGCIRTAIVTVNPLPADITGTMNVCVGLTTTLSDASTPALSWSSSTPSVASINSSTGVVTGVAAGTATITYTRSTGCKTNAIVTVNALPAAITGTLSACVGNMTTLADATIDGAWSSSNSSVADIDATSGVVSGMAAGTARITYTLSTGCIKTAIVTINTLPGSIAGTKVVCAGLTTSLSNTPTGGIWSSNTTSVATISAAGVVTGVAAGTSTITYTLGTSCYAVADVTVNALPAAITGTASVCAGLMTTLSDDDMGGTWTSANAAVATIGSADGIVTGVAAGTVNVTYTLSTGCIRTKVVTVNALPANINGTGIVCQGFTTALADPTSGGTWSTTDLSVASVGSSSGIVTGVAGGTATITYTITSTGCLKTKVVTVNPTPASIDATSPICIGATLTLNNGETGGTWSSSNTAVATVNGTTGVVTGNSAGTATMTYTASTGCKTTGVVTINGAPAVITGNAAFCQGNSITLADATTGGSWSTMASNISIDASTGVVSGLSSGTASVTYTAATGCVRTAVVTVNALPADIGGTLSVCAGLTTTLTDASTPALSWASSTLSVATINSSTGVVTGVAAGTSTITYTLSTGCKTTAVVTVNALPTAITGTLSACVGNTTTAMSVGSTGTWSSSTTSVATIGSADGIITGVAAGTSRITFTNMEGCVKTAIVTINVVPGSITGTMSVCVGLNVTLANATTGGTWTSSDATVATVVSTTGKVTGVAAGTATITYSMGTGCYNTAVVTVNALPAAVTGTASVCAGLMTTLSDADMDGTWTSANAAVATIGSADGIVTGVAAGTVNVTYTLGTGCIRTKNVTVNALPSNINGTGVVCQGLTTTLADPTSGGTWTSGMTSVATIGSANGVVTGVTGGTADVTYTITLTGCLKTKTVTVNPTPDAITAAPALCIGGTTTLTNGSTDGTWASSNTAVATINGTTAVVTALSAGTVTMTYTATTGCKTTTVVTVNGAPAAITGNVAFCQDGTITLADATSGGSWSTMASNITIGSSTGIVTATAGGTATVTYTAGTGCTRTAVITVNPLPATISGTGSVCVGLTTTLSSASTPALSWTSSTTSVATINTAGVVTGVSAGTSTITYTLSTGCKTTTVVTVNALPTSITGTLSACVGNTTTAMSVGSTGTWSSATTSVATIGSDDGIITGVAAGTSRITFTTAEGCIRTAIATINGLPGTIGGTLSVCVGSTTALANATTGGTWSSSMTSVATISATGVVTGVASGSTDITYSLGTGCTTYTTVTVNPLPSAITGTASVCVGSSTTLANTDGPGTWSNSSSAVATVGSADGIVTGVSNGTSVITYTLSTGCKITKIATVNALPQAIVGIGVVCQGLTTTFVDPTVGGTWSSSDMSIATVGSANGVITGVAGGTASIVYTLATGCTASKTVTVNATPDAISGAAGFCIGTTLSLSSTTSGGTWSSSNTAVATINGTSGVATANSAGTATITYTSAEGCKTTAVVTVNGAPAVITGNVAFCADGTITLANATSGGSWSTDATNFSIDASTGAITATAGGTGNVTYTSAAGCTRTTVVTVNALPAAISGTLSVCAGSTTTLSDMSTPGLSWTSSNTAVATVNSGSGVVTGVAAGNATITYTLATGCKITAEVTVNALPAAITGTLTVCEGSTTSLMDMSSPGTWSSSNMSVGTIDITSGVLTGIASGTTTIEYTISGGCKVSAVATVNALPGTIGGTLTVCPGLTTTLTNTPGGGTWSSSDASVATVGTTTGVVTGVAGGTATITYTVGAGCYVTTDVTVSSSPAAITGTASVCVGSMTTLANTDMGTWSISNASVATIGSSDGIVTGVAAGTATATYTVGAGCISIQVVTVNALPSSILGTASVCVGLSTTLADPTSGGTWSSNDGSIATVGSASGIVTGAAAGNTDITYMLSATGCYITKNVTVNGAPAAIGGNAAICIGSTLSLTDATSGGSWTSGNTAVATIGSASGVATGLSAGTANVTYTATTGCTVTAVVTVNGAPAAIGGTLKVCIGDNTTLTNASSGGTWSTMSSNASIGSSTGIVTGSTAGTAVVTYTAGTSCYITAVVTVNALPASISGTLAVCIGATSNLTDATAGGTFSSSSTAVATIGASSGVLSGVSAGNATITYKVASTGCQVTAVASVNALPSSITGTLKACVGAATSLSSGMTGTWTSSNAAVGTVGAATGVVTGIAAGTTTITYSEGAGCNRTSVVTINANPSAISGTAVACTGTTTTLTEVGSGTWTTADASFATVAAGVVTGVAVGTTNISFTAANGCYATKVVTVNAAPTTITGTTTFCAGTASTLANSVTGGTWSSSNTSVATAGTDGAVTGIGAGTANITYSFGGNCRTSAVVTVKAKPGAISGSTSVCAGSAITLTNSSGTGAWSSTNTAVGTIGSISAVAGRFTGIMAGTSTVSYTLASTGCASTVVVTVNASPVAGTISADNGFALNTMTPPTSTTLSTSGDAGGTWTSSTPAVATVNASSGLVSAVGAGTSNITYTVTLGGCSASVAHTVSVIVARPGSGAQVTVADDNAASVSIYPNPTKGMLNIETAQAGTFRVASVDGKEVAVFEVEAGVSHVSLPSNIAAGVYLCIFNAANGTHNVTRIVVE